MILTVQCQASGLRQLLRNAAHSRNKAVGVVQIIIQFWKARNFDLRQVFLETSLTIVYTVFH